MKNQDVRWRQRFQNFRKALGQLSKAANLARQRELSDLEQLGFLHRFEFTHELAWKTLKDFFEARGTIALYGPKDSTREAFAAGLIEDGGTWMAMIQSRNQATDICDEETIQQIARMILSGYLTQFEQFEARFLKLECEERVWN